MVNKVITVVGGGNIGTSFACTAAAKGYKVNVLSSRPQEFDKTLEMVDEYDNVTEGKLNLVTDNIEEAVKGSSLIFVTYPSFKLKEFADDLMPFITEKMAVCMVPGTGAAEFAFHKCIQKGLILSGLQRVPAVCRLEKYGKRVRSEGKRAKLFCASIPSCYAKEISATISDIFDMPCVALPNYLSVTLTPSNPILHTSRLRTLFGDYKKGKFYDRNPLFYGEWSDESSELLLKNDEELQKLCKHLDKIDLSNVVSLKIHYENDTVRGMTDKITSIKSLHDLQSPMIKTEEGWIPNIKSRYFTADFPYGLAIIQEIAKLSKFPTPNIDETMDWYKEITGDLNEFSLSDYGIHTLEQFYELYN